MPKIVRYDFDSPVVSVADIPLAIVLEKLKWVKGTHLMVEFPEGIWKNPVLTGRGRRELNPDYPENHSQKYQWVGSPHEKRIPRPLGDDLIVNYMGGVYKLSGGRRVYSNGKAEMFIRAEKLHDRKKRN